MALAGDGQALRGGEGGEEPRLLERPAEAPLGPLVRRQLGDVLAPEAHPPLVDGQEPGDAVEQRGLAGAVLADEAEHLALAEVEVDVVHRADAAEALHHAVALEDLRARRARARRAPSATSGSAFCRRPFARSLLLRRGRAGAAGAGDEHRAEDVGPVEQVLGGAGEAELALLHEHRALGEPEGDVDRLLHHHDREPGVVDAVHDVDELADDRGRQAERQLVDEEELRVRDERLAHRQHLLLAAGEVAGHLVDAIGEPREQREHPLLRLGDRGACPCA